jgi:hypothetical protein
MNLLRRARIILDQFLVKTEKRIVPILNKRSLSRAYFDFAEIETD